MAAGLGPRGERTCPRCGVMVLKVDGCDHIECLCESRGVAERGGAVSCVLFCLPRAPVQAGATGATAAVPLLQHVPSTTTCTVAQALRVRVTQEMLTTQTTTTTGGITTQAATLTMTTTTTRRLEQKSSPCYTHGAESELTIFKPGSCVGGETMLS